MMMRKLLVALIAANLLLWAWSLGAFRALGFDPTTQHQPERLNQQIHAEAIHVRPGPAQTGPDDADEGDNRPPEEQPKPEPVPARIETEAEAERPKKTLACWQTGPFSDEQAASLQQALQAIPGHQWRLEHQETPGRWMVYLGPFDNASAIQMQRAELTSRGIDTDGTSGAFSSGLSLGRFGNRANAEQALAEMTLRGIDGARIVAERPAISEHTLILANADVALRDRVGALTPALAGRAWQACD